ncbi:MAG: hypothetical protein CM1200mP36_08530 [Gammaproteobacteria bacterium]|nr:MAG: hypothetical protein CM1200mP36_08530 [Gammaproteobacteria bacterium]
MLKFFALLAAGYTLVLAAIYLMQDRMLYLPNVPGRALTVTPGAERMDYEDVSIETDDGVTLHGWFVPGGTGRVLLFFHGNAGNISHRLESINSSGTSRCGSSSSTIEATGKAEAERLNMVSTVTQTRRGVTSPIRVACDLRTLSFSAAP